MESVATAVHHKPWNKGNSPTSTVLVPDAAGRHHRLMECVPA